MSGGLTAPWAGYLRASAMWSEGSLTGRASSAERNDLQKAVSDILGGVYSHIYEVTYIYM